MQKPLESFWKNQKTSEYFVNCCEVVNCLKTSFQKGLKFLESLFKMLEAFRIIVEVSENFRTLGKFLQICSNISQCLKNLFKNTRDI